MTLLSICIPTYNRKSYLERTLPSIAEEITRSGLQNLVEICVSDNCSDDGTDDLVLDVERNSGVSISYKKLEKNIGAPRNFLSAVDMSGAKYVWLMGSDDWIVNGSLSFVMERLQASPDSGIFLGDRVTINQHGKVIETEYWGTAPQRVAYRELPAYVDSCSSIGGLFSFISDIVFEREEWVRALVAHDLTGQYNSPYVHVYILLHMIKRGVTLAYLHKPLVYSQSDNDSFLSDRYFSRVKIDFEYLDIAATVAPENHALKASIRDLVKRERTMLHLLKAKCSLSNEDRGDFFATIRSLFPERYVGVRLVPNFVVRALLLVYPALNRARYRR